jgi:alpha-mannosidase
MKANHQAFFNRWWFEQDKTTQDLVKTLVSRHQLEFIDGGWTQHDEACPYYLSMIDQTTLGHKFLLEEFNYVPRIGWQIDPFGHSATQAALLSAEVGFDALYFARLDYQDRDKRRLERSMEMVWRSSPSLGPETEIFAGAFVAGSYGPPSGMDWNFGSNDAPVMDDPCLEDDNVAEVILSSFDLLFCKEYIAL